MGVRINSLMALFALASYRAFVFECSVQISDRVAAFAAAGHVQTQSERSVAWAPPTSTTIVVGANAERSAA